MTGTDPPPHLEYRGFLLDDFQVQAIRALDLGHSVLVGAPTGAGKTLIAEYALDRCMREGRRIIYTAPVKALSNQKFRDFSGVYGDRIGVLTGDVSINPDAQALIMTTEILRNTIFENPRRLSEVDYVIFDEVHYIDDEERGTVWEESIIFAPEHIRFVCLSATVPNLRQFAAWIREIRKTPIDVVEELRRPVPLAHHLYIQGHGMGTLEDLRRMDERLRKTRDRKWEDWARITGGREKDLLDRDGQRMWRKKLLDYIQENRQFPVLYFVFSRRECEERSQDNVFRNLLTTAERDRAARMLDELSEKYAMRGDPAYEKLERLLLRGIGYHHAGLLPTLKEIVERMFTANLVKLVFATETFALGINMPARTVVFDALHKFDGVRRAYLKTREYQQMAGRAGRRGMDEFGHVYASVEWPFVHYDQVERILTGPVEEVDSQFNLSYATLMNLHVRLGKNLFEACEKSFANFRAQHPRSKARFHTAGAFKSMVDQVRRRMAFLRHMGYIDDAGVTEKGAFARRINGYEIQVTEFLFEGLLDQLGPEQMNVLFNAIVFESKKRVWYEKIDRKRVGHVRDKAMRIIHEVRFQEKTHGIVAQTKELDFLLAASVDAWSHGCEWADLESYTAASDGDLVRAFRLTHQLERQVVHAVPPDAPIRERLRKGMGALNRDVVDAERQLRLG